jgi:acyl-CoA reductase-like NAD-dependent aldehyde dehydrogenase
MLMTQVNPAKWVELPKLSAVASLRRESLPVIAPFTGEVLARIPAGLDEDVQAAVERARDAQPSWAARPYADRARIFLRFHDLLLARQDEILDIVQLETGKARRHAFEEILDAAVVARHYAWHGEPLLKTRRRRGALPFLTAAWESRRPVGVVGFIVPWNYPLNLAVTDAIPALLAGNAAVLRPDPQTSLTALWLLRLLQESGLPPDVAAVVTGDGPSLGQALTARADYIMFTGSSRTGRLVGRQAAERLIECSLELGGKNPMILLSDAGLDRAVDGAVRGCFVGAGQTCVSTERIYVHSSLYAPFLRRFADRAKSLKLGAALDFSVEMGSLTSERQLRVLEEHLSDAVEKGAVVETGGKRRPDLGHLFFEPTIVSGVRPDMRMYAEETFGPLVAVYPFESEDEAVRLANQSRYGLIASVWTRNERRGRDIACRIEAGAVNINEAYSATWGSTDAPTGGWKESGIRPRHGHEGILKFTRAQTIAAQRLIPLGPASGTDAALWARTMTTLLRIVRRTGLFG